MCMRLTFRRICCFWALSFSYLCGLGILLMRWKKAKIPSILLAEFQKLK